MNTGNFILGLLIFAPCVYGAGFSLDLQSMLGKYDPIIWLPEVSFDINKYFSTVDKIQGEVFTKEPVVGGFSNGSAQIDVGVKISGGVFVAFVKIDLPWNGEIFVKTGVGANLKVMSDVPVNIDGSLKIAVKDVHLKMEMEVDLNPGAGNTHKIIPMKVKKFEFPATLEVTAEKIVNDQISELVATKVSTILKNLFGQLFGTDLKRTAQKLVNGFLTLFNINYEILNNILGKDASEFYESLN